MTSNITGPAPSVLPYTELYHRRINRIAATDSTFSSGGANVVCTWHLMPIDYPMAVTGYHIAAGTAAPTDGTLARIWIQAASTTTFAPTGAALANSDTGAAGFNIGVAAWTAPSTSNVERYLDTMLSNPCKIYQPGYYWVGMAHQSPASGGTAIRGSAIRGQLKGLRDLLYSGSTPLNAAFSTFTIPTAPTLGTDVAGSADASSANIEIGLICQRLG